MIYKRNEMRYKSNLPDEDALQICVEQTQLELDLEIDKIQIDNRHATPSSTKDVPTTSRATERSSRRSRYGRKSSPTHRYTKRSRSAESSSSVSSVTSSSSSSSSSSSDYEGRPYYADPRRERERIIKQYKASKDKHRRHKQRRKQRLERDHRERQERSSRRNKSNSSSSTRESSSHQTEPSNRPSAATDESNKQPQIIIVPIPQPAYPMGPYAMQPQAYHATRVPFLHPPNGFRPQMAPPPLMPHRLPMPGYRPYIQPPPMRPPMRNMAPRERLPPAVYRRQVAQRARFPPRPNRGTR